MTAKDAKDLRQRLKNAMSVIDELETQIDGISKQKALNEKQIEVQKNVIQELRKSRDNSVELDEYQVLKEDFDKHSHQLLSAEEKVELLSKKLMLENNEIEMLHKKCSEQTEQIHDLEKSFNECMHTIENQNEVIVEINNFKEKQEFYRKQFESTLSENSELKELLEIYKNEDLKDSNVSVEDLNESMTKFLDSIDDNATDNDKTFDTILDIKLADIQKALDEKKRLNDELIQKTKQMNEEINRLTQLRREVETKGKQYDNYLVEKQSFERVFSVVENHVLAHIPLNRYFVPIGRRMLFSLTPKCLLRALPK